MADKIIDRREFLERFVDQFDEEFLEFALWGNSGMYKTGDYRMRKEDFVEAFCERDLEKDPISSLRFKAIVDGRRYEVHVWGFDIDEEVRFD